MAHENNTGITIDFTGEELIQIGLACVALKCTFSEFVDQAIAEAVEKIKKEKSDGPVA